MTATLTTLLIDCSQSSARTLNLRIIRELGTQDDVLVLAEAQDADMTADEYDEWLTCVADEILSINGLYLDENCVYSGDPFGDLAEPCC